MGKGNEGDVYRMAFKRSGVRLPSAPPEKSGGQVDSLAP